MSRIDNNKESPKKRDHAYHYFFNNDEFLYTKALIPNDAVLWLALGVPITNFEKTRAPFSFHIPETLVYGYSKNPIWLFTDSRGNISRSAILVDRRLLIFINIYDCLAKLGRRSVVKSRYFRHLTVQALLPSIRSHVSIIQHPLYSRVGSIVSLFFGSFQSNCRKDS
jgi:hypothetical protein